MPTKPLGSLKLSAKHKDPSEPPNLSAIHKEATTLTGLSPSAKRLLDFESSPLVSKRFSSPLMERILERQQNPMLGMPDFQKRALQGFGKSVAEASAGALPDLTGRPFGSLAEHVRKNLEMATGVTGNPMARFSAATELAGFNNPLMEQTLKGMRALTAIPGDPMSRHTTIAEQLMGLNNPLMEQTLKGMRALTAIPADPTPYYRKAAYDSLQHYLWGTGVSKGMHEMLLGGPSTQAVAQKFLRESQSPIGSLSVQFAAPSEFGAASRMAQQVELLRQAQLLTGAAQGLGPRWEGVIRKFQDAAVSNQITQADLENLGKFWLESVVEMTSPAPEAEADTAQTEPPASIPDVYLLLTLFMPFITALLATDFSALDPEAARSILIGIMESLVSFLAYKREQKGLPPADDDS